MIAAPLLPLTTSFLPVVLHKVNIPSNIFQLSECRVHEPFYHCLCWNCSVWRWIHLNLSNVSMFTINDIWLNVVVFDMWWLLTVNTYWSVKQGFYRLPEFQESWKTGIWTSLLEFSSSPKRPQKLVILQRNPWNLQTFWQSGHHT